VNVGAFSPWSVARGLSTPEQANRLFGLMDRSRRYREN